MSLELVKAVSHNEITVVRELLNKPRIHKPNFNGGCSPNTSIPYIPLFRAIYRGNMEIAELLIQHGASFEQKEDRYGLLPLDFVARYRNSEMLMMFFQYGADINVLNIDEYSGELQIPEHRIFANSLYYLQHHSKFLEAIIKDDVDFIDYSLTNRFLALQWCDGSSFNYEIDINFDAGVHGLPIQLAAQCGNPRILAQLLAFGADPNQTSIFNQQTALSIAIGTNIYQNVRALIDHIERISLTIEDLSKLLDLAIVNNDLELTQELLSNRITPLRITKQRIVTNEDINLTEEMKLLLAQYDLRCSVPSLQWLSAQTIARAIAQEPANGKIGDAHQEDFVIPPLVALARKINF